MISRYFMSVSLRVRLRHRLVGAAAAFSTPRRANPAPKGGSVGEVLAGVLLGFDEHEPVTGVVAHDRLDAVGPVGRLLQEGDALGGQLLVGLAAVVDGQADAAHA